MSPEYFGKSVTFNYEKYLENMEKRPTISYVQSFQKDRKEFDIPKYMKFIPAKITVIDDEEEEKIGGSDQ